MQESAQQLCLPLLCSGYALCLCPVSLLCAAFRPPTVTNRMTAVDDSDWWMFSYKVGLHMDDIGSTYSRQ